MGAVTGLAPTLKAASPLGNPTISEGGSGSPIQPAANPALKTLNQNIQNDPVAGKLLQGAEQAGNKLSAATPGWAGGPSGYTPQGAGAGGGSNGGGITGMGSSPNPAMPNITSPVTPAQLAASQAGATTALGGSQNLLNALTSQGGAANQTGVFNQGNSLAGQLGAANGIGAQTGAIGSLQDIGGQQQATAQQLQNVANGQGPNPAQAMLNQATGQNVANQAALMAGQRGAGANVGLMARQAAQQGAAAQQQAAGQGATMQAQQSLGALGQLTGQQQAMAGTQGQIGALGQGLTAQQQAQLAQNAGVAQNQVGNLIAGTGQNISGNLQNVGQNLGAAGQFNSNVVSGQNSVNAGNTAMNVQAMAGRQGVTNTLLSGASGAIPVATGGGGSDTGTPDATPLDTGAQNGSAQSAGANAAGTDATVAGPSITTAARGGYIGSYADGGDTVAPQGAAAPAAAGVLPVLQQSPMGPQSAFGRYLAGLGTQQNNLPMPMAGGGKVKALLSENEVVVPPRIAKSPEKSAAYVARTLANGGGVKASTQDEKATKPGNSYANDKIEKSLPEGAIVIPRSVMQSKDPARGAADFVAKIMARRSR